MARKRQQEMEEVEMDMTPMIDVVFNLIIFFMLVTQMVTEERADLQVPIADQAKEDRTGDKDHLVINVHNNGQIEIKGEEKSWDQFKKLLYLEADIARNSKGVSERAVIIRGDIRTPFREIQKVMVECARKKIYKISIAAKTDSDS